MDIKNCKICRKIFQYPGFGEIVCPTCRKVEYNEITKIEKFLYINPDADVNILSKELEIPTKRLFYYIKNGSIQIKNNDKVNYCKRCSNLISFGEEYCEKCKKELVNEFKGILVTKESEKNKDFKDAKMRFLKK